MGIFVKVLNNHRLVTFHYFFGHILSLGSGSLDRNLYYSFELGEGDEGDFVGTIKALQTLLDSRHLADEKMLDRHNEKLNFYLCREKQNQALLTTKLSGITADGNEQEAIKGPLSYNHFGSYIS